MISTEKMKADLNLFLFGLWAPGNIPVICWKVWKSDWRPRLPPLKLRLNLHKQVKYLLKQILFLTEHQNLIQGAKSEL